MSSKLGGVEDGLPPTRRDRGLAIPPRSCPRKRILPALRAGEISGSVLAARFFRVRVIVTTPRKKRHRKSDLRQMIAAVEGLTSSRSARGKNERQEAERRKALLRNRHAPEGGTARPPSSSSPRAGEGQKEGAARLSAFHHGACGSDRTPPLSLSHATSWDEFGARNPDGSKDCAHRNRPARNTAERAALAGITRAFSSQSSEICTRRPVVMPVGRV